MTTPADNEFSSTALQPELVANLSELGYLRMTPVQAQTLPEILAGRDVLARANTGSGKTAAFGLGLLDALKPTEFVVQALVLCPTRELADQVVRELRRLARPIANLKILALCGGMPMGPQLASLQHSPHVLVGTPGRILKHLDAGNVGLSSLQTLVLDEADRLLDMGFAEELNAILRHVPHRRQTLLFSATYPESVASMSGRVQRKPAVIDVTEDEAPVRVGQYWCRVTRDNRSEQLLRALKTWGGTLNLVFCNTKNDCAELAAALQAEGIVALALHGDLDQPRRTQALVRFANRSATVMVATDVAARGIDVTDIDTVFNYELPRQPEVYLHRIGRTARAGSSGRAVSLVEEREQWRLQAIRDYLPDARIDERQIPATTGASAKLVPQMVTIQISGGRKNKLRPGDLLGALTADGVVSGKAVGAIDLFDDYSYVAIRRDQAKQALRQLASRPIKGRQYRARMRR